MLVIALSYFYVVIKLKKSSTFTGTKFNYILYFYFPISKKMKSR